MRFPFRDLLNDFRNRLLCVFGALKCREQPDHSVSDPSVPLIPVILQINAVLNTVVDGLENLCTAKELQYESEIVIDICMCKDLTGKLAKGHAGDFFFNASCALETA